MRKCFTRESGPHLLKTWIVCYPRVGPSLKKAIVFYTAVRAWMKLSYFRDVILPKEHGPTSGDMSTLYE